MKGKQIIIGAHGNSIRAIVMHLQNYTPEQILKTEIGWCEPWIFDFEDNTVTNLEIIIYCEYTSLIFGIPYSSQNSSQNSRDGLLKEFRTVFLAGFDKCY